MKTPCAVLLSQLWKNAKNSISAVFCVLRVYDLSKFLFDKNKSLSMPLFAE